MADISIVKELREKTDFSFAQINKALDEAGGDKEKAIEILKQQGASIAEKKSSRATGEGIVEAYIHSTHKVGAVVVLRCETDFVARNPIFTELARNIAMHISAMDPKDSEDLMAQEYIKDTSVAIKELINQVIAKLGENIQVASFGRYQI